MTYSLSTTLVGGLGNRLFQLSALRYFASTLRVEQVNVRVGEDELPSLQGRSGLISPLGFSLSSLFDDNLHVELKEATHQKRERHTMFPIQRIRDTLARRLTLADEPSPSEAQLVFNRSTDINQIILSGFAQSRHLVSASNLIGFPTALPTIENRTERFDELASIIRTAGFSLAVHVRGGDYRKPFNKRRLGLLPPKYFAHAMEVASEMHDIDQVFIFTDDVDYATYTVPKTHLATRIISNMETSAAQALSLMSACNSIVLSNSTLSWWAAKWASSGTSVYAPSPWYRGLTVDLLEDSWTHLQSYFD